MVNVIAEIVINIHHFICFATTREIPLPQIRLLFPLPSLWSLEQGFIHPVITIPCSEDPPRSPLWVITSLTGVYFAGAGRELSGATSAGSMLLLAISLLL